MPIIPLIIFQVLILAVIVFVLKKMIFTDTTSAVNRLNQARSSSVKKQEELEKKINELEENRKEIIRKANEEADNIKAEARKRAEEELNKALEKAKSEAEEITKKAFEAKDKIRGDLEKESDFKAADYAHQLIEIVLTDSIRKIFHNHLVEDFVTDMDKIPVDQIGADLKEFSIETAYELDKGQMEKLEQKIESLLKRKFEVKSKVSKKLYAGVILKFGTLALDGSLSDLIKDAIEKHKINIEKKY